MLKGIGRPMSNGFTINRLVFRGNEFLFKEDKSDYRTWIQINRGEWIDISFQATFFKHGESIQVNMEQTIRNLDIPIIKGILRDEKLEKLLQC